MERTQAEQNAFIISTLTNNPELVWNKQWRMDNLYWIIGKKAKKVIFKMNAAQKHFFDNYLNIKDPYLRHVILKSRQLGFTTFLQIWMLDEILFNKDVEALGIAHIQKEAVEIFDRKIDFPIRNMCEDLKNAFFTLSRNSARKIQVKFDDDGNSHQSNSSISVSLTGRSGTFQYVHISEYAPMCVQFPKKASEVKSGTFPSVPKNGYIFIESTAETTVDDFHNMFNAEWYKRDTLEPADTQYRFMPHFYNWTWDEDEINTIRKIIDIDDMEFCAECDWRAYQMEHNLTLIQMTYYYQKWVEFGRDMRRLNQQYPTIPEEAFLSAGQTYFSAKKLEQLKGRAKQGTRYDILFKELVESHSGDLEVWEKPIPGVNYIIGGDTAQGLAHGDAQVLSVVNCVTEEVVAIYKSQIEINEYPDIAMALGKYYNKGMLAIENNFGGNWLSTAIVNAGYENVYFQQAFDDITRSMTKKYGWNTTRQSRSMALTSLKALFLRNEERHFPKPLLEEMASFVINSNGKPEALSGKHDDIVLASSIAYAVLFQYGKQIKDTVVDDAPSLMKTIFGESSVVYF